MSVTHVARIGSTLSHCWRGFRWYVEGVLGADAYRNYVDHLARTHPERSPVGEREFWRDHLDWQDRNPQGRCC